MFQSCTALNARLRALVHSFAVGLAMGVVGVQAEDQSAVSASLDLSVAFDDAFWSSVPSSRLTQIEEYEAALTDATPISIRAYVAYARLETLSDAGRFEEAADFARLVYPLYRDVVSTEDYYADFLTKVASFYVRGSDFESAFEIIDRLNRSVVVSQSAADSYKVDQLMVAVFVQVGDYQRAADLLEQVVANVDAYTTTAMRKAASMAYNNLSYALIQAGDYQSALDYVYQGKEATKKLKQSDQFDRRYVETLDLYLDGNLVDALFFLGDHDEALPAAIRLRDKAVALENQYLEAHALKVLGQTARVQNRPDDAVADLGRAADIAETLGDEEFQLTVLYEYALALTDAGQVQNALHVMLRYEDRRRLLTSQQAGGRAALFQAEIARERRTSELIQLRLENEAAAQIHQRDRGIVALSLGAIVLLIGGMTATMSSLLAQRRQRARLQVKSNALRESERKAQAAARSKAEFLANMSHEIRTPLNGVLGMAQVLASKDLDVEASECVDTIVDSGRTLMSVVNDILDVSKIEAGKMEVSPTPGDLKHSIKRLMRLWEPKAREKGIDLLISVSPDVPACLMFDSVRVRQCVSNLVSNAIKFTERGSVSVVVDRGDGSSDMIRISVSDTGAGIAEDQQGTLFEAFQQADNSSTRAFGGTGLGLTITHNLAQLMGGGVTVRSILGKGSTFELTFRAEMVEVAPEPEAPAEAKAPSVSLSGLRLLLADDNLVNRKVARAFLNEHAVTIIEAEDGVIALEHLRSGTVFDMVLLDIHMPVMDGVEAIKRIRGSGEPWADIPVIALTADAMEGDRERYLSLGMDGYVAKPIVANELVAEMVRALSLKPIPVRLGEIADNRGDASMSQSSVDQRLKALAEQHHLPTDVFTELRAEWQDMCLQRLHALADQAEDTGEKPSAQKVERVFHDVTAQARFFGFETVEELSRDMVTLAREHEGDAQVPPGVAERVTAYAQAITMLLERDDERSSAEIRDALEKRLAA